MVKISLYKLLLELIDGNCSLYFGTMVAEF